MADSRELPRTFEKGEGQDDNGQDGDDVADADGNHEEFVDEVVEDLGGEEEVDDGDAKKCYLYG